MWSKIICCLAVLLCAVDNAFATNKAINSASKHFSKEGNMKLVIICGGAAVGLFIIWLALSKSKSRKKK